MNRCCRFPVVLSSDDEEEADDSGAGNVNRLDSVSPRPADSAHSSPAPSGGRVEAAVKNVAEQEEINTEFFEDVNMKITIPRRARMKDQVGLGLILGTGSLLLSGRYETSDCAHFVFCFSVWKSTC